MSSEATASVFVSDDSQASWTENSSVDIINKKKYKSLFSISSSIEHPYETIKILKNKKWKYNLDKAKLFYRRQDFDINSFFINGAIFIIHRNLIRKSKNYDKNNHGYYKMPKHRSIEINDLEEAKIVQSILKN